MKNFTNFASFAVCASLPLYIARFKIFGIPVTLLEVLILLLVIAWFFEKGLKAKKWSEFFGFNNFYPPIIFLLLAALISTILSYDQTGGIGILKAYFVEPALLFLVISDKVRTGGQRFVFFGIICASIWLSTFAIFQKITGLGFADYARNEILAGRVVAVYNSANSLALFLGPVLALSFDLFLTRIRLPKVKLLGLLIGVLVLLQFLVMILTKSEGGIIAILIVFLFILLSKFLSFGKILKVFYLIALLALFLNFALPVLAFLGVNFSTLVKDETLQNRYFLWQGTVSLVLDRPLIGAGLDGFRELYGESYRLPQYDELLQYPHNLLLTFWSELGLLGVFAIFWFFFQFAKNAIKNRSLGLLAALLYILVHGIVDVPYFKNDLSAEFFVLAALAGFKDYNKLLNSF